MPCPKGPTSDSSPGLTNSQLPALIPVLVSQANVCDSLKSDWTHLHTKSFHLSLLVPCAYLNLHGINTDVSMGL